MDYAQLTSLLSSPAIMARFKHDGVIVIRGSLELDVKDGLLFEDQTHLSIHVWGRMAFTHRPPTLWLGNHGLCLSHLYVLSVDAS